jgi:plastocyanin
MRFKGLLWSVPFFLLLTSATWGKIDTVKMIDFSFVPAAITIAPGDTIVWKSTQQCCIPHTTTRAAGPMTWNSGDVALNGTFQLAFPNRGTFNYECIPHGPSGMTGVVTVVELPKVPVMGYVGLALLLASLAAAGIWMLYRKRQTT